MVAASACSKQEKETSPFPAELGKSPKELVTELGPPKAITPSVTRPQAELYQYPDGTSYQSENGKIVGRFAPPQGPQRTLQYWKHHWKGRETLYKPMPETADQHGQVDYLYSYPAENMAVIYDPRKREVVRVIHYR